MPSKRQPSKQRRAAQNRAKSQSLAARRENASHPAPSASGSSGARSASKSGSTSAPVRRPGLLGSLLGPGPAAPNPGGSTEVVGNPGRTAVLVSLFLATGVGVAMLVFSRPTVDDRGDLVGGQNGFGGLHIRAREALTGGEITTEKVSVIDGYGPGVILVLALPALVALGAFLVYRKRRAEGRPLYWPTTIAMVLMALVVFMSGALGLYLMPAMVAMAVASFQVRKAEMPARMAERAAAQGAQASEDDDVYDEDDEYDEDEYEDEEDAEYEDEDDEVVDEEVDDSETPKK